MKDSLTFIRPYLRGWTIIAGAMALAFWAASRYLSYVTPLYESTAKLRLADVNEGVPNSNLYKDFDVFANTPKIQAEIELLKSQAILKKALRKIPFDHIVYRVGQLKKTELFNESPIVITAFSVVQGHFNRPFLLTVNADSTYTLTGPEGETSRARLGDTLSVGGSRLQIDLAKALMTEKKNARWADHYEIMLLSEDKLIAEVLKNLDVTAVDKDVPVIRISYKSPCPEKAAMFPNALAEAYIEDYIETKYGAANVAADFLDGQIKDIGRKLSDSENGILHYREQNGITNLRQETETDLRKISQLEIQQTNLKMSLDAIRELETYIDKGRGNFLDLAPNFEAFTDLLSTEMVKKIKQLQAEKKDLLLQYTSNDERVKVVDEKIKDLTAYLTESIHNTRKNLESKYNNLQSDITQSEQSFIPVPEKERVMTILNREFEIYQQSYNFLNQKKIEAEIARAAKVAFHRIITPARISKAPVSPNYVIIKGLAVILGMIGAILLIFIVHTLKARVNNISSIESVSMIPVAVAAPKMKTIQEKERFFTRLLTQWKMKGLIQPQGILCFTGFDLREGVHFISAQVLQILKKQGKNTLVIEIKEGMPPITGSELIRIDAEESSMTLWTGDMYRRPVEDIQRFMVEHSRHFDQTIIINTVFGDTYTLAMMDVAALNMVCLDTRLTPAKKIAEVDLMTQEYKLPAVHFAVNRVGYAPGLIRSTIRSTRKAYRNWKNKSLAA